MSVDDRVAEVIAGWQEKLLQLDRRNNVLYFKPGRRAVPLLEVSPDEIVERLGASRGGLSFPYAERVRSAEEAEEEESPSAPSELRVTPGDLSTDVDPVELQARLARLQRYDREWEEEQGLNVLFLAVGFMNWIDGDGVPARSPLVLIPCDLQRASPRDAFYLTREDDDAVVNPTLALKLKELGIELPELGDEALSHYLASVSRMIRNREGWAVSNDILLSTFAYSKLAMYEDLEGMRTGGVDHELITQLAGVLPPESPRSDGATAAPDPIPPDRELVGGKLDDLLDVRDQFTVLDADFSQLRAIETARQGSHLVIHGPPGTGKSQTIANLIATLLADGKKVLFVSEKTAALDVVKRRLEDCGLGVFCLDMHSERGKKNSVYDQLAASLSDPRTLDGTAFPYETLTERRSHLNRVVRVLHTVRQPLGQTPYQVQGRYAQVQRLPRVDFEVGDIAALDEARVVRVHAITRRIEVRASEFEAHETSRWRPLTVSRVSVQLPDRLRDQMQRVTDAVSTLLEPLTSQAEWAGVRVPETAASSAELATLFDHLAAGEGVPAHWLNGETVASLQRVARTQEDQQSRREALVEQAAASFGEDRPDADYRQVASAIERVRGERRSFEGLLGTEWRSSLLPDPGRSLVQVRLVGEAADAVVEASSQLSEALSGNRGSQLSAPAADAKRAAGGFELGTAQGLTGALEIAHQLMDLFPVPESWLDPAEAEVLRRDAAEAREQLDALENAEALLEADFADSLVDLVDQEMLIRYRTDYQSFFHRLGGAYRRDQRLLRGQLKAPRKLSAADSLSGIERALDVKRRRDEWRERAPALHARFGNRFRGRETDWERVVADLEGTIALRRSWKGGADRLHALLTEPDANQEARVAVTAVEDSRERLMEALSAIARNELFEGAAELAHLRDFATRIDQPLQELSDAMRPLVSHFRELPADLSALAELVEAVLRLEAIEREDADLAPKLAADFGDRYRGGGTDWPAISSALEWTDEFLRLVSYPVTDRARGHATTPQASTEYARRATEVRAAAETFVRDIDPLNEDFDVARTTWGAWDEAPWASLREWAEDLSEHATSAADWVEYRAAVADLEQEFGPGVVDRIRNATADSSDVPGIVDRRLFAAWLDHAYEGEPILGDFTARDQEDVRRAFRELDEDLFKAARWRVRERCFAAYPDRYSTSTGAGQLGTLRSELSKRRRRMPVRRLFRRVPGLMQALKPCFLMSPLAVSQYLPHGQLATESMEFDVVIFDEASQVFPEDAVPALARAKYAIVAGDTKQLPPTNFFRRTHADDDASVDDDEDEDEDSFTGRESILDVMVGMAGRNVAEQYLTVHYRSKHESLIRYSNHYFYDDRLLTFPAPVRDGSDSHVGIKDIYLPDGRYDAAASRNNKREAQEVVERVFDLMRSRPESESIGVVALSRAQADYIDHLVEERRLEERDLDERFAEDRHERFFVKNLENVQGDERDHIILSVGYGPTVGSGAVPNRFGPINPAGGQRRLNVAVSRARLSMTVVHSLRAEDIVAQSDGARLLRRYLEYVRNPSGAFEAEVTVDRAAEPESPFEEEVRRAIEGRGYRVDSQVGVSGYRIDLGIASEDGTRYDLGIECDGATYHRAPAARDRDRQRQQVLEGLGWRIHRVWSTAWARNAEGELAAIERAIADARAGLPGDPPPPNDGRKKGLDLREVPPPSHDAETRFTLVRPLDSSNGEEVSARLFEEYREASLSDIRVGPELKYEVQQTMTALIRRVVEVEQPVHLDLVVERIRDRYALRRAGSVIRERVERGIREAVRAGVITRDGSGAQSVFLRTADGDDSHARRPSERTTRNIDHIANSELDVALVAVAAEIFGAERDQLVVETARELGFDRTGQRIEHRLRQAIDRLLKQGTLRWQFDTLVTVGASSRARAARDSSGEGVGG